MNNNSHHATPPAMASLQQTYPGGKGNCYQQIINQIPPHTVYIEPFLGYGAVMRAKKPATLSIGIDKDKNALNRVASSLTMPAPPAVNGDGTQRTSLRPPMAANIVKTNVTAVPSHMTMLDDLAIDDVASAWLMHGDALPFLATVPLTGDEFVYADPPYLFSARKSKRPIYDYELGTEEEHTFLLDVLTNLSCPVAISGYYSELYADMLYDWRSYSFQAVTRGGTMATEWVWMNYPKPRKLHEYTFLGDNFRERERIKRKAGRWVSRFTNLPSLERAAIIDQLHGAGISINGGDGRHV